MCFFPVLQVIYALNTKNDEHEAAIATLKEAHEEEVQQILSETREKILQVCVCVCLTLNLLGSLELCTPKPWCHIPFIQNRLSPGSPSKLIIHIHLCVVVNTLT